MRDFLRRTRVRLTLAYTAAAAVMLTAGAAAFWFAFTGSSLATIDSSLRGQAQVISSGLEASGETVLFHGGSVLPAEAPDGTAIGALILDSRGAVVDAAGIAPEAAAVMPAVRDALRVEGPPVLETRAIAGVDQRLLIQRVTLPGGRVDTLVLSHPLDLYESSMHLVALLLGITVVLLVGGSALSAYLLAGRVLSPVRRITAAARDLSEHSLDRRLHLDLPADELGRLAATFDAMLDRLQTAFDVLQRFTADAAHELRGPLAALRSEVEVTLRRERDVPGYRHALAAVLAEADRLTRIVDHLLVLARADAGELRPALQQVDVFDFLEEAAEHWRALAGRSGVAIVVDIPQEELVTIDPELMRRAVDNLVGNAIRHSPAGGTVAIAASFDDTAWRLTVRDQGPGVDRSVRPRLFRRFSRSDPARGRDTGGSGLGLALTAAVVAAHGGTIRLDEATERGACFVVELPRRRPDRDGAGGAATTAPGVAAPRPAQPA